MSGQTALPWAAPAAAGSRKVPAHEAEPWGQTRPSAQIPCSCPSFTDRPTSAQGCLEVPEKLPRGPAHLHLQPQPHPGPTHRTPSLAQGKPGQGRPPPRALLPSQELGIPHSPPPLPHPPENHPALGGGGVTEVWEALRGKTCQPVPCLHPPLHTADLCYRLSPARNIPDSPPSGCDYAHRSLGSAFEFLNKSLKLVSVRRTERKEIPAQSVGTEEASAS